MPTHTSHTGCHLTRERAPWEPSFPSPTSRKPSGRMIDFAGRAALRVGVGSRGARGSSLHLLVALSQGYVPLGMLQGVPRPLGLAAGRGVGRTLQVLPQWRVRALGVSRSASGSWRLPWGHSGWNLGEGQILPLSRSAGSGLGGPLALGHCGKAGQNLSVGLVSLSSWAWVCLRVMQLFLAMTEKGPLRSAVS